MPATSLQRRASFPNDPPSRPAPLHPAAIFAIVAVGMFILAGLYWFFIIRTWKKIMTNKEYGILPTIREAATATRAPYPKTTIKTAAAGAYDSPPPQYSYEGVGAGHDRTRSGVEVRYLQTGDPVSDNYAPGLADLRPIHIQGNPRFFKPI